MSSTTDTSGKQPPRKALDDESLALLFETAQVFLEVSRLCDQLVSQILRHYGPPRVKVVKPVFEDDEAVRHD